MLHPLLYIDYWGFYMPWLYDMSNFKNIKEKLKIKWYISSTIFVFLHLFFCKSVINKKFHMTSSSRQTCSTCQYW